MDWPLGVLLLLLGSPLIHADPMYILVTPRVMRVGTPEIIHLQAESDSREPLTGTLEVKFTVKDYPLQKREMGTGQFLLVPANNYMDQKSVVIPNDLMYPPPAGQQHVVIEVTWPRPSSPSSMKKLVLVAPHAGYIYIQTDKPIYTPDHPVQYRVFTVNHKMDPVSQIFTLDIKNPEGITVISKDIQSQNSFFSSNFHLPELVSLGSWTIEAHYQSAPKQKFKTSFEVKEYVLPSFEVQLKPNKTFFSLDDEALGVDINARYTFNQPVDGHALAIFGVKLGASRVSIQTSLQRVEVSKGLGHVSLRKDTLMAAIQDPEENMLGATIFLNVTVFSTGGEMVQAHTSGVKVVKSPYNIKFIRTPQYFKPGMPFHVRVLVSNPDGSPAPRVPVRCQNQSVYTSPDGVATLKINTEAKMKELPVLVETVLQGGEPASASMMALPYSTQDGSGNYLHLDVMTLAAEVGGSIQLSLNTMHQDPSVKDTISHFTLLVLSKGQIVYTKHQLKSLGSVYTSTIIEVTPEMLPSFRILAFYLLPKGKGRDPELVADSLWIDVVDRCMGTLKIGLKDEVYSHTIEPNKKVNLKVTGDGEAKVGLVAVDKAVYVLSSKDKLTQKKIWDVVEEYDMGCTAGSGENRLSVFKDAGLDLKLSTGMDTLASSDWSCPQHLPARRHRRHSLKRMEAKKNAVLQFETEQERRCCEAGLRANPAGLPCPERARHVRHGPRCLAAFMSCCRLAATLAQEALEEQLLLGTVGDLDEDEEDEFDESLLDDQPVRTYFPESWLWRTVELPKSQRGKLSETHFQVNTPDSITTWQFVAISLKTGQGLCVSEPLELTVRRDFFVDLKLPPSIIRNEQVQIQAVLYNFMDRGFKVRVEFPYKEALCSAAKPETPFRQVVYLPGTSSKAVPFVLLPLELGKVDVEVKVMGAGMQDHVRKTLLVQAGGEIQKISRSIFLDPRGQKQTELISRRDFLNLVPGTEAEVFVSIQGDILGETILGILTPRERTKLLTLPAGCPEQTLSKLTPVLTLARYLDTTGQWGKVGIERRERVMENIASGYTQMLAHRSADGTYHTSKGNPGSTWLTSYVFRVFSLAYHTAAIRTLDLQNLCALANWLITQRQAADGHFVEEGPVVMASMQGGYQDSEAEESLTALVLIALDEGKDLCHGKITNLPSSMERARGYLETRLPSLNTTFAVTIVSYALALSNSPRANDHLDSFASQKKTYWPVKYQDKISLYTIEATAYALMQKLKLHRYNETEAIVKWLVRHREIGGGFVSTQTTVVAIEALTRFAEEVPFMGTQDLKVKISVPKRALNFVWTIDQHNAYQQRSAKFSAQDDLNIEASGTGRGTISILTMYHKAPESGEETCDLYHLNVTLQKTSEVSKSGGETFRLLIRTRYQGDRDATMSIAEVALLTGFSPNQDDLKQLTNEMETYAFQYETKTSSSNSTVVFYLEKVSHDVDTVLGFRVHRLLQAEFMQAARVTIYDYYDPSHRCSVFYNVPTERASLRKICHKDICRCAEEQCPRLKTDSSNMKQMDFHEAACESGMDFVYKVRLEEVEIAESNPYVYYNMVLQAIIKSGTDPAEAGARKKFISHATCHEALGLREGWSYLIMGHNSDLWKVKSDYSYVLGKSTFLLHWPSDQHPTNKGLLTQIEAFADYMSTHGCET